MRELLVVVNGAAGTADDAAVRAALAELRRGADVRLAATSGARELAAAVAGRGDRRLVVLGGDGTVHATVRALDDAGGLDPGEPIGLVPGGTGNDLARALGIPLDPVDAAAAVLAGTPRPLDLLRDGRGGPVVNAVHVGVGARAYAESIRFKQPLGRASFPLGAAIAGVTTTSWDLRVELDGRVATHETAGWAADGTTGLLMVAVCNGPTVGGGTPLAPDAVPDDGLADVVISAATGPVARVAFAAALADGRHGGRDDVLVTRARTVAVSGPPLEPDADGELHDAVADHSWHLHHHAWSVLVPP
ncbi:diacylglycerol/lipid kinase family protein [Blastococcus sp. SYSU D00669]